MKNAIKEIRQGLREKLTVRIMWENYFFMFLQLLKTFLYVNQRSSSMRVALTSYKYFCQIHLGGSVLLSRNRAQIPARSAFLDSTEATGSLRTRQKRSRQEKT